MTRKAPTSRQHRTTVPIFDPYLIFRAFEDGTSVEVHQRLGWIKDNPHWVPSRRYRIQLIAKNLAQHRHAAIAGIKMFLGVERDFALAHLSFIVARHFAMLVFCELLPELALVAGSDLPKLAGFRHAPRRIDAEMRIIDGEHPAQKRAGALSFRAGIGDSADGWQHCFGNAAMSASFDFAKLD